MSMWTRVWSERTRASTAPAIPKDACSTVGMRRPQTAIQAAAFRRPIAVRRRARTTTGDIATANQNAPAAIQPTDKVSPPERRGCRPHSAGPRDGRQTDRRTPLLPGLREVRTRPPANAPGGHYSYGSLMHHHEGRPAFRCDRYSQTVGTVSKQCAHWGETLSP